MPGRAARRLTALVAVAGAISLGLPAAVSAAPGDLDGAYGVCGYVLTATPVTANIQAADNVIALPNSKTLQVVIDASGHLTLVRLLVTGAIDRSYAFRGRAVTDLRPSWTLVPNRQGYSGANGRVYLIGSDSAGSLVVEARRADGSLDPMFDGDGRRSLAGTQLASAVVQPDGRIVVADWEPTITIRRLDLDGSDDPSFVVDTASLFAGSAPIFMAADGWHRIYVVAGNLNSQVDVYRLTPDGALDPSYTFGATFPAGLPSEYRVLALAPQDDGELYLAEHRGTNQTFVARTLASGALDATFGTDGWVEIALSKLTIASDLVAMADGSLLVTGMTTTSGGIAGRSVFVVRRAHDGTSKPQWPDSAVPMTPATPYWAVAQGAVLQNGGITLGVSANGPDAYVGVARFQLDDLQAGAGLMLGWDGDAWPTRFGNDPGPECPYDTPYWRDWDIARGITTVPGKGGYVVDGYGGIHRFSIGLSRPKPATAKSGPYWNGWDITRGVAAKPDGTGGYVLDGFGGLHPFHTGSNPQAARAIKGPYWLGWDIARDVALMPDGRNGYVLDGFGGVHRFATPGHALPPKPNHTPYWLGWDIARAIAVLPDGTGGYVVDAFGGAHPFGVGAHAPPPNLGSNQLYASGADWVRGFAFVAPMPSSTPAAVGRAAVTGSADALRSSPPRRRPTPSGSASP